MVFVSQPWPWYVSGPLITLTMFLLLAVGKQFGMSSSLRTACAIGGAGKVSDFFNFNWKEQRWNLLVVLGAVSGGYLASEYLTHESVHLAQSVVNTLDNYGIKSAGANYLPAEIFSLEALSSLKNVAILSIGGILVGFGARYAGGCTSGHAISGLSNLQIPSLIAVIGFFVGGLFMVHIVYPLIF
ncbi:MAG: YeeE/YedE thiosulfate transporter family protein [Bacteroidota bacterium]